MAEEIEFVDVVMLRKETLSVDGGPARELLTHSRHTVPAPVARILLRENEDRGPAAIRVEDIEWKPKSAPEDYLENYPGGKSAKLARILLAHPQIRAQVIGEEEPETAEDEETSTEPSDSSDASSETSTS